jgi:hypothetical protein
MRKSLPYLLCLAALAVVAGVFLRGAQPPAPGGGKVLLLDNDRALEGDIERFGDRYRIRRAVGELWLPADKVRFVGVSWAEALSYLRSQANLIDPDERLRLARWCQVNGLHTDAIVEAKEALGLRPNSVAAREMVHTLEHTGVSAAAPPGSAARPSAAVSRPVPSLDLNAESLAVFVTKVQPILMNTCASCHATDNGGKFKLLRTYGAGSRRTTQVNLAAVMEQVKCDRPELSPLLIKAVSAHGPAAAAPPLPGRRSVPYQLLRQWVESTLESNPHLKEERLVLTSVPAAVPDTNAFASGDRVTTDKASTGSFGQAAAPPRVLPKFSGTLPTVTLPDADASAVQRAPSESPFAAATTAAPRPTVPAQPMSPTTEQEQQSPPAVNEYSPDPFNRQFHPNRKG